MQSLTRSLEISILGSVLLALGCGGEVSPPKPALPGPTDVMPYDPEAPADSDGEPSPPPAATETTPSFGACKPVIAASAHDISVDTRHACRTLNAMAQDQSAAGLDYAEGAPLGQIGGTTVAGCLRIDLDREYSLASIKIIAKAVGNACQTGTPCVAPYCGTGQNVGVFYGVTRDSYRSARNIALTSQYFQEYRIPLEDRARYIALCRLAWGPARDDFEIDAVIGCAE